VSRFSRGEIPTDLPPVSDFPRPFNPEELWRVNYAYVLVDLIVGLVIIGCVLHFTRFWFKVPARGFQLNLLTLLWMPAAPVVAYLLVYGHTLCTGIIVAAFAWFGVACTAYGLCTFPVGVVVRWRRRRQGTSG
jgi:hypothetical protein